MADVHTPEQRRRNMKAIRSRDTKPEVYLRRLLFACGYRFRISPKYIFGHPDVFLRKYNTAIFVHGCFWHRHPRCKYATTPKTNETFWLEKFAANVKRDEQTIDRLHREGIRTVVIWECTLRTMEKDEGERKRVIELIERFFVSDEYELEV